MAEWQIVLSSMGTIAGVLVAIVALVRSGPERKKIKVESQSTIIGDQDKIIGNLREEVDRLSQSVSDLRELVKHAEGTAREAQRQANALRDELHMWPQWYQDVIIGMWPTLIQQSEPPPPPRLGADYL